MKTKKGTGLITIIFLLSLFSVILFATSQFIKYFSSNYKNLSFGEYKNIDFNESTEKPSPLPYKIPELENKDSYRIILIGDSMMESLGVNANPLRLALKSYYPDKEFVTYNYSVPSSNILSVPKRLNEGMQYLGQSLPPILNQGYDLLIFESFAYNPLSEYSIEKGLEKQTDVFENVLSKLATERTEAILLMSNMIAPDKETFAQASRDLSQTQRNQWIEERLAYMDNAKKFAEENNIPFIDIYRASLDSEGDVVESYIAEDTIHPSTEGINFISEQIASYIYEKELIPKK